MKTIVKCKFIAFDSLKNGVHQIKILDNRMKEKEESKWTGWLI
jgi:hypothetical protein